MQRIRSTLGRSAGFLLALLGSFWLAGWDPVSAAQARDDLARAADELFSPRNTNVLRIAIEAAPASLQKLKGRSWSWSGASRERPEIQVTVREGGQVYTNVALHLKGSAGSFQPVESKPGLTLNFDKFAKGQTFHGLTKMSLNNSVQDPSFFSEKICRELFEAAGVPAPRADFATVELNGRKLGFYVLLEGYNRQFLRRHFKNTKGNLYDGGFLKDVDATLATNSGENPKDQSDLRALVAASKADRTNRFERLSKVLDMERFITFIATEVMVCHWDGYAMNKNNYRVYHDLDADRIMFMPHGMDQVFGVLMADTGMPIRPPMQGLIARAVMDTSEGRRRFYERLAQLNKSLFDLEALTNRVHTLAARIRPVLAELGPSAVAEHEQAVFGQGGLCERIAQRKQSLEDQLAGGLGKTLAFDNEGVAPLAGWTCSTNYGKPFAARESSPDGKPALHIRAGGHSIASWRTKVLLEDGHYSFEARMQTKGIAADPHDARAGAGLRVVGGTAPRKTLGDSEWNTVIYEFDVPDGIHDVELVCELRAASGEVWFDADSLKLVRR